jgi:hypothetical protein
LAHNFHNVVYSHQRPGLSFLQCLNDASGHRHAEIGADKRFLEVVPIDGFTGEMLGERLKEFHLFVVAVSLCEVRLAYTRRVARRSAATDLFALVRARAGPNLFLRDQECR